ncbi:MAG: transposase [Methylococcales bacterium]
MPRVGRVVLPNYPHHIVQRGHNRQVVFAGDQDFEYYLETLSQMRGVYGVRVYAWCLMTNHIHLVVEPPEEIALLGQLMKRLSGRQTRYVNRLEGRSGTLWESRYKSSPIQTDEYLLACIRYVELNPVRAQMVTDAYDYRWSSYNARMKGNERVIPDLDPCYLALGDSPEERRIRYREYLQSAVPDGEWAFIQEAVERGQLTGNSRYVEAVEKIISRRIEHRRPGRPRTKQNGNK